MQRQQWKGTVGGAAWGSIIALAAAVAVYVYFVHLTGDPPGLDGDRFMAASLFLGLLGAPLSVILFEQIGDRQVSTAAYYAAYLIPIALNGAAVGASVSTIRHRSGLRRRAASA